MPTATLEPAGLGCVQADAVYTLNELRKRLGMSAAALRNARRAGLRIKYIGKRGFCLGRDVLAFIESHGRDTK